MMSTKTEKYSGQLRNPFSGFINPYQHYSMGIDNNLQLLRRRFPNESAKKMKGLLEEMDGNLQMTIEVLEQECGKQTLIVPQKTNQKVVSSQEQNHVLKKAVAQLYKKLREREKEVETLKQSNEKMKRENQHLAMKNRILLENQFQQNNFDQERDVY